MGLGRQIYGLGLGEIGGLTILVNFNKYDEETMELLIENEVLRQKIMYWWQRADTLFNAESIYGVFEAQDDARGASF